MSAEPSPKITVECWQCGGCGLLAGCFEDCCSGADCDPEDAEYCCCPSTCDICNGKGAYEVPADSAAARDALGLSPADS
jgi:hypothetical protein